MNNYGYTYTDVTKQCHCSFHRVDGGGENRNVVPDDNQQKGG